MINVAAEIEAYNTAGAKVVNREITFKIEEQLGEGIDIINDFNDDGDQKKEGDGQKNSEDSDNNMGSSTGLNYLEYDEPIKSIFTSRHETEVGYTCLIGNYRFTVYDICDNGNSGTEYTLLWDHCYRFDMEQKVMGQIECADFGDGCKTLVTGTNLCWIILWDIKQKVLLRIPD